MAGRIRQYTIGLALFCMVIGFASSAFAVPPGELLQMPDESDPIGQCCFSFNQTVAVTEPAKPFAVVVTWGVQGFLSFNTGGSLVGLIVNGAPCTLYGPASIPEVQINTSRSFQWVIFPSDGLRAGNNTFTLCGGGRFGSSGMLLGPYTLAARLSN